MHIVYYSTKPYAVYHISPKYLWVSIERLTCNELMYSQFVNIQQIIIFHLWLGGHFEFQAPEFFQQHDPKSSLKPLTTRISLWQGYVRFAPYLMTGKLNNSKRLPLTWYIVHNQFRSYCRYTCAGSTTLITLFY